MEASLERSLIRIGIRMRKDGKFRLTDVLERFTKPVTLKQERTGSMVRYSCISGSTLMIGESALEVAAFVLIQEYEYEEE